MSDYLDASALVSVLLGEPTSRAVRAHLRLGSAEPIISSFGVGECSAAIAGLVVMGRKTESEAVALLTALDEWVATSATLGPIRDSDITEANCIVRRFDLKLRLPDAIHVATARRMNARLITLDRRMAAAANALGIACINPTEISV